MNTRKKNREQRTKGKDKKKKANGDSMTVATARNERMNDGASESNSEYERRRPRPTCLKKREGSSLGTKKIRGRRSRSRSIYSSGDYRWMVYWKCVAFSLRSIQR